MCTCVWSLPLLCVCACAYGCARVGPALGLLCACLHMCVCVYAHSCVVPTLTLSVCAHVCMCAHMYGPSPHPPLCMGVRMCVHVCGSCPHPPVCMCVCVFTRVDPALLLAGGRGFKEPRPICAPGSVGVHTCAFLHVKQVPVCHGCVCLGLCRPRSPPCCHTHTRMWACWCVCLGVPRGRARPVSSRACTVLPLCMWVVVCVRAHPRGHLRT